MNTQWCRDRVPEITCPSISATTWWMFETTCYTYKPGTLSRTCLHWFIVLPWKRKARLTISSIHFFIWICCCWCSNCISPLRSFEFYVAYCKSNNCCTSTRPDFSFLKDVQAGCRVPWHHHALKILIIASWFMFSLREKEISQNEHLQKSLWGEKQPTAAVHPRPLHEGASGPEEPQTGKDVSVSGLPLCSGTVKHSMW